MKSLAAISLFLLIHSSLTAQLGIETGYAYHIDHPGTKAFKGSDNDNPFAQDQFAIGCNYLFNGWEFGLDVSGLINRQHFYNAAASTFSDSGAGGSTTIYREARTRGEVAYAYTGLRLSAEKWFDVQRVSWMQIGVGLFQHADFLVSNDQSMQQQSYQEYSVWYSGSGNSSTTVQQSEWEDSDDDIYAMKEQLFYFGANLGVRFQWKSFYAEPSASVSWTHRPRAAAETNYYGEDGYSISNGDKVYPSQPFVFRGAEFFRMHAFGVKVGYRFGGKKAG